MNPLNVFSLERPVHSFFNMRALDLAPRLLGLYLIHDAPEGITVGEIIETEAYEGPHDRASHAFGGRLTPRTQTMHGPPGHAYVYFTYGMHWMMNVVSAPEGTPHGVLLRSLRPVTGMDLMEKRRGGVLPLAEGPGRLCQAMGISGELNGVDLLTSSLRLAYPPPAPSPAPSQNPSSASSTSRDPSPLLTPSQSPIPSVAVGLGAVRPPIYPATDYLVTKRVGIGNTGEAAHYPWRFVLKGTAPARLKIAY